MYQEIIEKLQKIREEFWHTHWTNPRSSPVREVIAKAIGEIAKLGAPTDLIIEDSGWSLNESTSIVRRGIRDYNRTIKFGRDLTHEEIKAIVFWLHNDQCPGWTGVRSRETGQNTYTFSTTYDSSD